MNKTITKVAVVYAGAKNWGGIETYLQLLFEGVDAGKVDLTLISLGQWPLTEKLKSKKLKVKNFPKTRINIFSVFSIANFLRKNKFDLVVSQGNVPNAYARAASLLSSVPNLVTVHSDIQYDYSNPFIRTIYVAIELLTRFPTKHYIAVSEYLRQKLIASGIPASKITVIYNGVPATERHPELDSGSTITIGSIGRLHKVKNYDELIRACSLLKISNFKLQIAGEGSERKNLEGLIVQLNLSKKVELLGKVENVNKLFSGWDIYIQPSLSEGFGLSVVEAMLAKKPVIVSPVGSLVELVKDGKTGIITTGVTPIEIANSLNMLLINKELRERVAKNGYERSLEIFSVKKWIESTLRVYRDAIL